MSRLELYSPTAGVITFCCDAFGRKVVAEDTIQRDENGDYFIRLSDQFVTKTKMMMCPYCGTPISPRMREEIIVTDEMVEAAYQAFDDFALIRPSGIGDRDSALVEIYRAMQSKALQNRS